MSTNTLQRQEEDLRSRIHNLNEMVRQGQLLEAHDRFYADDCVQQENEQEPVHGKAANRRREEEFLSKIVEFRGAEVKSVAVDPDNNVTSVEWFFDYTHSDWGDRAYHQVAVQRWSDGKIVHERFYYDA